MGGGGGKQKWIQSFSLEEETVAATVLLLQLSMIVREDLKETLSMVVAVVEEEDCLGLGGREDKPVREERMSTLSFWTLDVSGPHFWVERQLKFVKQCEIHLASKQFDTKIHSLAGNTNISKHDSGLCYVVIGIRELII